MANEECTGCKWLHFPLDTEIENKVPCPSCHGGDRKESGPTLKSPLELESEQLRADRDALVAAAEGAVEVLGEYENAILSAGWTRHQQDELNDCRGAIAEFNGLLARIKSGQPAKEEK